MLSNKDKETYSWQLDLPGFSINEQAILRKSTALVSRVGGMGGAVALSLAAAGIGKIILCAILTLYYYIKYMILFIKIHVHI